MRRSSFLAAATMVAVLISGGCSNLDVENPNAPDANRAFVDPAGLQQLLGGAFRTWVETRGDYFGAMPMTMMADSYTASWNNAAIRFYNSVGVECASRCGWTNSATAPEAAGGPSVESQWYGYYTVVSSATDVLKAIANGTCFDTNCTTDNTLTSRNKAIAKMLQAMGLAGIALVYDSGFVVDETTDLSNPLALPFAARQAVRDAAITKFEEAFTEAGLKSWSTDADWMGVGAGTVYTNSQVRQLIRTMQAELLAMYPRDAGENATVNWAQVATYASAGISSGTQFDWEFFIDATGRECGLDCIKTWGNSIGTGRVDTRVAALITTNHVRPWPEPAGNPCPTVSADRRVGDGSWGPADDFNGYSTKAGTVNAGTDFACSGVAIFPAARGQYHQSNLVHIRYQRLAYRGENLPANDGTGQDPFYTRQMSDLLWAEGLLRGAGSAVTAAGKINNSRVTRGGLAALTGAETNAALISAMQYEQELEFMGQGPTPFFNRRRIDGFTVSSRGPAYEPQSGTPLHMPVPAKELDVLQRAIYTFGGPGGPAKLMAPGGGQQRETVRDRFKKYQDLKRTLGLLRK
ncbi:MAG: hypothetical protein AABZ80_11820 [Gemmatimonadota bacterium]|mgnify:CR=1 FL=1